MDEKLKIIIIISSCFLLYFAFSLFMFFRMRNFIKTLKENVKALDIPKDTMIVRTEASKKLLEIIDEMISIQIVSKRKFEIFLNQKNKNLDMDNVIKEISTDVLKSLKENVLIDSSVVYTQEYIMQYIIEKTTLAYIAYIQDNVAGQL